MKKLVLIMPGLNRNLILEANTLYFAIGKILKIRYDSKKWELVTVRIQQSRLSFLLKSTIDYMRCGGSLCLLNCIKFEFTASIAGKSKV